MGSSKLSYSDSVNYCLSLGMTLASIHSDEENDEANNVCTASYCWIGAYSSDQTSGYDFTWSDGSEWEYTNWSPNEPNDSGNDED